MTPTAKERSGPVLGSAPLVDIRQTLMGGASALHPFLS